MCQLELWKRLSFRLCIYWKSKRLLYADFHHITLNSYTKRKMWEILLKLHCDSDILNYILTQSCPCPCFPKQCHLLRCGEHWWCSTSEKHILLLAPESYSKLLILILQDLTLGFIDLTRSQAVTPTWQLPPPEGDYEMHELTRVRTGAS